MPRNYSTPYSCRSLCSIEMVVSVLDGNLDLQITDSFLGICLVHVLEGLDSDTAFLWLSGGVRAVVANRS
jgi:hypothetical protein